MVGARVAHRSDESVQRPDTPCPANTLTFDNKIGIVLSKLEASLARRRSGIPDSRFPVSDRADLLQGTLDLLVLKSLVPAPLHGWGISKRIRELSRDVLQVNQGSLYPALYRLEDRGWVASEWGISPEGRRAKFYRLTAIGRKQVVTEQESWRRFALAIEHVLEGA